MTAQDDRLAIASIAGKISMDRSMTEVSELTADLIDIYNRATDRQYKLTEFVRELAYADGYAGFKEADERLQDYSDRAKRLLARFERERQEADEAAIRAAEDAQLSRIESSACDR